MRSSIRYVIVICLWVFSQWAVTQTLIVKGRVLDAATLEPIAFASVFIKSTTIGTTTNFEGYYSLSLPSQYDSLSVSSVGYNSSVKALSKEISQEIHFNLTPATVNLLEVVITPGENPAITLLKKVWANLPQNNINNLDQYSVDSYTKTQVYLRSFSDFSKSKNPSKIFDRYSMTAEKGAKPVLPVYMSETLSTDYYLHSPKRERTILKDSKINSLADVDGEMVAQLIQNNNKVNFNDNNVRILDKNFVSPISTSGLFYYKYYLSDSLFLDDRYCYEVRFVPKREEDLTFSGTFWINDSTFALKRISAEVGKNANLNFVDRIKIQQDLAPIESGAWIPEKTRLMADAVNIFLNVNIVQENFSETNHSLGFYLTDHLEVDLTDQEGKLLLHRKELDLLDRQTTMLIDSLKRVRSVRFLTSLVNMSIKGYWNLGKVELGPYLLLYSKNSVEGHRFRVGFRTNSAWSEKWVAKGYLAYGTLDQNWKYNAQLERFLSRRTWTKVGIQYSEDLEKLGSVDEFYHSSSFFSFASSFGGTDQQHKVKLGRLWLETDFFRGFTQKLIFMNKSYHPASSNYHFGYFTDDAKSQIASSMTISEINLTSIYQPGVTMIVDKNERFPISFNKNPTLTLSYSLGIDDFLGSDFSYHKGSLGIKQDLLLGSVGRINYDLNLKKVFTPLPYPLLIIFHANESFFRTSKTFNLMRHGEFVADQSAELFLTFRQDGFILDKIPLIKKLRWRSIATASIAYGSFDHSKNGFYDKIDRPKGILPALLPDGEETTVFNTLSQKKPYVELSYGIENIFRFFRVEAIHRLSYLQSEFYSKNPARWGIKFSADFRF